MYKHLFGPVPSRRLGMSLGVDIVYHKVCTLDCIYCECGETTCLTLDQGDYVKCDGIMEELQDYFKTNPDPDYITFSGSGEPTLNRGIGKVIDFIKTLKPHISIAVLTNGTLLSQKEVRESLLKADLVMPSLDAASNRAFQRINRPHDGVDIQKYIRGLQEFRQEFQGKFALEVFILPGYNDSMEDLTKLREAMDQINPHVIQLNTIDRPGVEFDLKAATGDELLRVAEFLGNKRVEIIAKAAVRKELKAYRSDMESAILTTIKRRPCTLEDMADILGTHINEINKYLASLEEKKLIQCVRQPRGIFYHTRTRQSNPEQG